MSDTSAHQTQVSEIQERAALFHKAVIAPQVENQGSQQFITDSAARNDSLRQAVKDTIFDSAGEQGPYILGLAANAARAYHNQRGALPSVEMMSSMYHTIENMLDPENVKKNQILDSAMSTSDGIVKRNHQVALVVPTMLMSVTADMVTHIPANFDKSEIFSINRVAGSTFGDLTKGDIIDPSFNSQYSSMDQRKEADTGDGSKKQFTLAVGMPIRKHLVRVYVDKMLVAEDLGGKRQLSGNFVSGSDTITITGSANYDTGAITVDFSKAVASGIPVHIGYDINIEKSPNLIPKIEHEMESWTLYPHESALACSSTIQAAFGARREFNIDLNAMNIGAARNVLAAEKDRKRLRDMYFFAKGSKEWSYSVPAGVKFSDHYESIREVLQQISQELMFRTKKSGLVGIVAGPKAAALLKSIGAPHFIQAPGYRHIPQPHYVGAIFGYDFKEDPFKDDWEITCYAKGRDHGDSGYVAADAISAINYAHAIGNDLQHANTLYELAYRDMHPRNGRDYYTTLKLKQ